jgi:hypothetical protein
MDDNRTAPTQGYLDDQRHQQRLLQFVVTSHTDLWREHRDTNYLEDLGRVRASCGVVCGLAADKNRESERSRIVTPAIRQAIDSRQAEIEEAIFGRKDWFDCDDDDEQDKRKGRHCSPEGQSS